MQNLNDFPDVPGSLTDRIAQAIGDPGSIVGRKLGPSWGKGNDGYAEHEETVTRWSTRAVLTVLTAAGECGCPGGYDLTPPPYRYVIQHTDKCVEKRRGLVRLGGGGNLT